MATDDLRETHGIEGNGTIAYFKIDPKLSGRVPQLDTVRESLANNYLLRKIMTNPKRTMLLLDENNGKPSRLGYKTPGGNNILTQQFSLHCDGYGDFPISLSIFRAEGELTQIGDDRDGGLLITDDANAVLDMSLFRFDNEPLAAHMWGEVIIGRFRELLEKEEAVLSEERFGLLRRHPFCQKLITEIEQCLELKTKEERSRKQKEQQSQVDVEEFKRYKKAFSLLNEIAETEATEITNLSQNDIKTPPPNGFCLYPSSAQITVGKRYSLKLRLDTKDVRFGATISITSSNQRIRVITPEIKITSKDGTGILDKFITIEGIEPNIEGIVKASWENKTAQSKISVIPEKELLLSEGMAFQPESVTLRPNQPRRVHLLVYVKMIEVGSTITITPDNSTIKISTDTIIVKPTDAERHIAKYELEIWGEGVDQNAIITAESGSYLALLGVKVRSKSEEPDKGKTGMFSEPEYNITESDPSQKIQYSRESGKIIIFCNFPSVKLYLGENCQYKKTLLWQVIAADLVAERCFYEIARQNVDSKAKEGMLINPENLADAIQRKANELSKKHGKKVHEILVDQTLLKKSRS